MTNPDFQFLRTDPVDLKRYLPVFLYLSPEFKAIQDALGKEHERQRQVQIDVAKQFKVKTATWGLVTWERMLGITDVDIQADLEMRRATILAKLQNPESVTEAFLTNLANRYIADRQGTILSYPQDYRIEILYHGGQVLDYGKLRGAISTYIPAHIGYKLVTISQAHLEFHGAGLVRSYKKELVDMKTGYSLEANETTLYAAGFVSHQYKLLSITGGGQ